MTTSAEQLRRVMRPRNNSKPKANLMDQLVCHNCGDPVSYDTAIRIPAKDIHPPGSQYLVCSYRCAKAGD